MTERGPATAQPIVGIRPRTVRWQSEKSHLPDAALLAAGRGDAWSLPRCAEIRFAVGVVGDIGAIRAAERQRILDGIRRRLGHEPTRTTKHVKQLRKLSPPFEHVPPVWQLRIGDRRVFYDVDEANAEVFVRAVRRKPPHTTTEEIL